MSSLQVAARWERENESKNIEGLILNLSLVIAGDRNERQSYYGISDTGDNASVSIPDDRWNHLVGCA